METHTDVQNMERGQIKGCFVRVTHFLTAVPDCLHVRSQVRYNIPEGRLSVFSHGILFFICPQLEKDCGGQNKKWAVVLRLTKIDCKPSMTLFMSCWHTTRRDKRKKEKNLMDMYREPSIRC